MSYKITVKSKNEIRTEIVDGIKSLRTTVALFKSQGWQIDDISRVA